MAEYSSQNQEAIGGASLTGADMTARHAIGEQEGVDLRLVRAPGAVPGGCDCQGLGSMMRKTV